MLPNVIVTVAADGLTATVDGVVYPQPPAGAWTRASFGPLMGEITKSRTISVRVEVRESDGGGTGITAMPVLQPLAQARDKWNEHQSSAIWDASIVKVILGGAAACKTSAYWSGNATSTPTASPLAITAPAPTSMTR